MLGAFAGGKIPGPKAGKASASYKRHRCRKPCHSWAEPGSMSETTKQPWMLLAVIPQLLNHVLKGACIWTGLHGANIREHRVSLWLRLDYCYVITSCSSRQEQIDVARVWTDLWRMGTLTKWNFWNMYFWKYLYKSAKIYKVPVKILQCNFIQKMYLWPIARGQNTRCHKSLSVFFRFVCGGVERLLEMNKKTKR